MKSRLGKADSIFKRTEAKVESSPAVKSPSIRPEAGSSVDNKLTIILPPDQVEFLDRLCLEIRSKTKVKMKRTEIIRALVGGLEASGLDLSEYQSEESIADAIQKRLKS